MSIREEIAVLAGDSVSLGKILRCACFLVELNNGKLMDALDIQNAFRLLFSDQKLNRLVNLATQAITRLQITANHINNDNKKFKIKNMVAPYGITRVSESAVIYLDTVYEDIDNYVQEDLSFSIDYNASDIIEKLTIITRLNNAIFIRDKHYEILNRILSPDVPININWNIDRSKDSILQEIRKYRSDLRITDAIHRKLISN